MKHYVISMSPTHWYSTFNMAMWLKTHNEVTFDFYTGLLHYLVLLVTHMILNWGATVWGAIMPQHCHHLRSPIAQICSPLHVPDPPAPAIYSWPGTQAQLATLSHRPSAKHVVWRLVRFVELAAHLAIAVADPLLPWRGRAISGYVTRPTVLRGEIL